MESCFLDNNYCSFLILVFTAYLFSSIPVTKWNIQVTKAEEIPAALAKAFYIAKSGRPGPVLIDITKELEFGKFLFFNIVLCHKSVTPLPPEGVT